MGSDTDMGNTKDQRKATLDARRAEVGTRIRDLRAAAGLSQAGMTASLAAHGVDLDRSAYGKMERGARGLDVVEAAAVAEVLGVPVTVLLPDSGDDARTLLLDFASSLERATEAFDRFTAAAASMDRRVDRVAASGALDTGVTGVWKLHLADVEKHAQGIRLELDALRTLLGGS